MKQSFSLSLLLLLLFSPLSLGNKFPGDQWESRTPEEEGMSSQKLKEAMDYASGGRDHLSNCASVHRNGHVIAHETWGRGESRDPTIIWSISKAVTGTLFGVAERERILNNDWAASLFINEWKGTRADKVTIDHLLRHDSGRYYDLITDFVRSQFQPSQTDYAIGLPQRHEPGSVYQYNQMGIQNLERILTVALNESVPSFTERELFQPLKMESSPFWMEKSVLLPVPNDPLLYGGMHMTCLDLARFGTLWLHRGQWEGKTIFTDEYFEKATHPAPPPRAGRRYHWGSGPNFRANGMGEQLVVFNPEKNLIITRIGNPFGTTFSGSTFVNMVMESFLDGDVGSWDVERDRRENDLPWEEKELAEFLRKQGFEVDERGEIIPLDIQGWFQAVPK